MQADLPGRATHSDDPAVYLTQFMSYALGRGFEPSLVFDAPKLQYTESEDSDQPQADMNPHLVRSVYLIRLVTELAMVGLCH